MSFSMLDPGQIIKTAFDDTTSAIKVKQIAGGLITQPYDEIDLTYVVAGNGSGEISTVTFKLASVSVNVLTLSYNASNQLISVVKS